MQPGTTVSTSNPQWMPYAGLGILVMAGSGAAILIRLTQGEGVPSLLIVAGRLVLATLILTPLVVRSHVDELKQLQRRHFLMTALAGLWLAVHFIGFVMALEYASVMVVVVLVLSNPLWAAILEATFMRLHPHRLVIIGLVCTIIGGAVIALGGGSDTTQGEQPLLGAGLAIFGALSSAVYMLIGRSVRPHLALTPYVWMVYGWGGLFGLIVVALTGTQVTGYSIEGYFWLATIVLIPQLIGHSSMNFALRFFSATYVSISAQSVVVFSTILAFILFTEVPSALQFIGSVIVLGGVTLASLGQNRNTAAG